MQTLYNRNAPKKPINLSVNSDLLSQAKSLHINISSVLESALADRIKQQQKKDWSANNKEAINSYNTSIDVFGVFSDSIRDF